MGSGKNEDLKDAVRAAVKEILAELRPMPAPASGGSVTEIIIRVGPASAMQIVSGGQTVLGCPPPCLCYEGAARPVLDSDTKAQLQALAKKRGETEDEMLAKIERESRDKLIAQAINESAKGLEGE